jgi:hypothetical protein
VGIAVNGGTIAWTARAAFAEIDGSGPFEVGRWSDTGGALLDGRVCELGFWKRLGTQQDVTDLYNGGAGLAYPLTVGGGGGGSPVGPVLDGRVLTPGRIFGGSAFKC